MRVSGIVCKDIYSKTVFMCMNNYIDNIDGSKTFYLSVKSVKKQRSFKASYNPVTWEGRISKFHELAKINQTQDKDGHFLR